MSIAIRRTTAEDWSLVRDVRLRALADAPTAFASRLEDERDRPESAWRERLSSVTSGTFLAVDEDVAVGIVAVFLTPDDGSRAHLVSMWVSPERRRARIGTALIDAVLRWSRDHGAQSVELWVTVTNEAARRLYLRSGFRETGVRQALPSDPSIEEVEMRLVHRGA